MAGVEGKLGMAAVALGGIVGRGLELVDTLGDELDITRLLALLTMSSRGNRTTRNKMALELANGTSTGVRKNTD